MTEYIDYNKFENRKVFFEEVDSKRDALTYFFTVTSFVSITSLIYYFVG